MNTQVSDSVSSSDTILIVDDSEMTRDILGAVFKESYTIETAENGQAGLELIHRLHSRICAILLDVVMPVMDGVEMLRLLAASGIPEQIPIFLITGETDDGIVHHAYELGVMDVISKPITPYRVKRRVNSVIELFNARKRLASTVEVQKDEIVRQAQQIVKLSMGMVESLSTAIEFRSGESGAHVRRIHDITTLLLRDSCLGEGFSRENIRQIALAAIMHDVGKLSVPDSILNKPGRLTPEEFEIMKTHTVQGCRLLEQIPQMRELPFFHYAYDIARHHHERWDGRGYPDGLEGDAIPLWAQVVSLADVYDALVSKRVYKNSFGFDKAVDMIANGECGLFNPRMLSGFLAMEPSIRSLYTQRSEAHVA